MADKTVIKEFLVKLGFQKDERSLRDYNKGIDEATAKAKNLGLIVVGLASAVGLAATSFAKNMEKMYFSSKLTNSAITNIKAFENAIQNITGAGEEAESSIRALADWMRYTPGSGGILKSMGIDTEDANGNLRDTVDIMADLGRALSTMSPAMAQGYAKRFGISEGVLRALMSGEFEQQFARQQQIVKDSGFDQAAQDAHEFMTSLRELSQEIQVAFLPVMKELLKGIGPNLKGAAQWMLDNKESIKGFFTGIADAIGIMNSMVNKSIEGWKNIFSWIDAFGRKAKEVLPKSWFGENALSPSNMAFGSMNQPNNGKFDVMSTLRGYGWTKDQAAGIMANLMSESGMNPRATGDSGKAYGIAQWHPDRQAAFKNWSGKDIRESTLQDQVGFLNYELTIGNERKAGAMLRATKNARQAGEVVSRYYERPLRADAEAAARGERAVQISQNTTINVNGGDPSATGRAVAGEQSKVNADLVRNFSTVPR